MIALLWACAPLGLVTGAVPIEQGQRELSADLQLARAPDALSSATAIPLPGAGLHYRVGLGESKDIGIHLYSLGLGTGVDLKYRWFHEDPWSVALDPRVDFVLVPFGKILTYGILDLAVPLLMERRLGGGWSLMVVPATMLRQTVFHMEAEQISTQGSNVLFLVGGGGGFRFQGKRVHWAISGELYGDLARSTGIYGGVDVSVGRVSSTR